MGKLKEFTSSSLFLPVVALAVLLVFNAIFVDGFLTIQMTEDGRLYGRLIDILTRDGCKILRGRLIKHRTGRRMKHHRIGQYCREHETRDFLRNLHVLLPEHRIDDG